MLLLRFTKKKFIYNREVNQNAKKTESDSWDLSRLKTIFKSLEEKVDSGRMTIREAAIELHKAGWTTYIDIEETKRLINYD